jgi:uncharacterized protein YndB with AHSA1/START domain
MDHTDRIERSVVLDAPADEIWSALTEPERVSDWFGADVEWDLQPGGRATFTFPDGRQRPARIDEVTPPCELVFHYLPIERDVDGRTSKVPGATVVIELEPLGPRTRLTITEISSFVDAYGGAPHGALGVPARPSGRRIGFRVCA